jgi:predicted HicB family RNase H-like nuclease
VPQAKPKPKKVGRPILPKNHARSGKVQVRLNADELRRVETAAKASNQTVSEWIRSILAPAIGG